MDPLQKSKKSSLEAAIQDRIIKELKGQDWSVMPTHGNSFQSGFPDLFCYHDKWGQRWIEVKNPNGFSFTAAQCKWFPLMHRAGVGIWILTAETPDELYKLHSKANWQVYYIQYVHSQHITGGR